jgi:hypothetical protein
VSYLYDSTDPLGLGGNAPLWYSSDLTPIPEPVIGVGQAFFFVPDATSIWTTNYSDLGGSVPALSVGQISDSSFTFNINGDAGTYVAVFISTDLTNWTLQAGLNLDDTGAGSYTDDGISGLSNQFYRLIDYANGNISQVIGFEHFSVPVGTNALVSDQLIQIPGTDNTLSAAFTYTALPVGAQLFKYTGTGSGYNTYTYTARGWDKQANLDLGEGDYIGLPLNSSPVIVTFVGLVREGATCIFLPNDVYGCVGLPIPETTLGLNPPDGTGFFFLDGSGNFNSFTYDAALAVSLGVTCPWFNGGETDYASAPVISVAQGFFVLPTADWIWTTSYYPSLGVYQY